MGVYLNPRNDGFAEAIHSEIYVDKTGLIAYTNQYLNTEQAETFWQVHGTADACGLLQQGM